MLENLKRTYAEEYYAKFGTVDDHAQESKVSRDIKVLSEVEKIWILHDLKKDGRIKFQDTLEYLRLMTNPVLELTDI